MPPRRSIRQRLASASRSGPRSHTGEIELEGGNVRGAAIHIAARIVDLAEPGQVYASWATRELLAGSPISFTDRGLRELKGLSEGRRVYLVEPSS